MSIGVLEPRMLRSYNKISHFWHQAYLNQDAFLQDGTGCFLKTLHGKSVATAWYVAFLNSE